MQPKWLFTAFTLHSRFVLVNLKANRLKTNDCVNFRFWRRKAWGFKSLHPHHFEIIEKIVALERPVLAEDFRIYHSFYHVHVPSLFCSRRICARFDAFFWLARARYLATISRVRWPVTA